MNPSVKKKINPKFCSQKESERAREREREREREISVQVMMNWNQKDFKNKICKAQNVRQQIVRRRAWLHMGLNSSNRFCPLRATKAASARDARTCIARCTRLLNGDFLFSPHRTDRVCGLEVQPCSSSAHITG